MPVMLAGWLPGSVYVCMSGVVEHARTQPPINPRLLPAIDQLLVAGIKLGPQKKHDAINKILELVPGWKRGDCRRRIRQLRRTPALAVRFRLGSLVLLCYKKGDPQ
jgi:hypothetical protein